VAALTLSACATHPDKIGAASISTMSYQKYNCNQIASEADRVSRDMNTLYGQLKKTADNDGAQMAVGMVLFWPALFFLEGGDGPQATEYAKLKGEMDALEDVAILKECDITFKEVTVTETETVTKETRTND